MYCALDFDKQDIALSTKQLQIIGLQTFRSVSVGLMKKCENSEDIPLQQDILLKNDHSDSSV